MSPDAAQLLRRLRAADEDALRDLFTALAPQAHALAQRIAGAAAADPILEEVLLLAWREPQRWSEQTFHAQLLRCVRDVAVLVRTREITPAAALARWRPPQIEPQSNAPLDRADAAERVRAALFALGPERRELLEAAWFEGASIEQLASDAAMSADEAGEADSVDEAAQMLTDALEQFADAIENAPMSADAQLGPAILGLADPPRGAAQDPAARRLAAAASSLALVPLRTEEHRLSTGLEHRIVARAREQRTPKRRRILLRRSVAIRIFISLVLAAAIALAAVFGWLAFRPADSISGRAVALSEDRATGVLLPNYEQRPFALVFWGLPDADANEVWQLWWVRASGDVTPGPTFEPDHEGRAAVAINPNTLETSDALIGFVVSLDIPAERSTETPAREDVRYQFSLD